MANGSYPPNRSPGGNRGRDFIGDFEGEARGLASAWGMMLCIGLIGPGDIFGWEFEFLPVDIASGGEVTSAGPLLFPKLGLSLLKGLTEPDLLLLAGEVAASAGSSSFLCGKFLNYCFKCVVSSATSSSVYIASWTFIHLNLAFWSGWLARPSTNFSNTSKTIWYSLIHSS